MCTALARFKQQNQHKDGATANVHRELFKKYNQKGFGQ